MSFSLWGQAGVSAPCSSLGPCPLKPRPAPGLRALPTGPLLQEPNCRLCCHYKKRGHGPRAVLLGAVGQAGLAPSLFSGLGSDHSPMHPPVHPSVCPSIPSFTCQPTHPLSICSHPSIHPSIFQSSIRPSVIQILTHLPIHPSIHIYPTIRLSMCLLNTYFVLGPVLGLSYKGFLLLSSVTDSRGPCKLCVLSCLLFLSLNLPSYTGIKMPDFFFLFHAFYV